MTPAQNLQRHPALCREAERLAKEHWGAVRVALENWNRIEPGKWTWDDIDPLERRFNIDAQARLLADLSRPESRDWMVRRGVEADGRWRVVIHSDDERRAYFEVRTGANAKSMSIPGALTPEKATGAMTDARAARWSRLRNDPDRLLSEWLEVHDG
jgi:hypothetical protein